MNIETFIQQYSVADIKIIETNDLQFLALKKSRDNITKHINNNKKPNKNLFLFLVLQCALVSYQISGSGELWRSEFGQKISQDRNTRLTLRNKNQTNTKRRYNFLTTSKYNKRIYNIKTSRLKKFDQILEITKDFGQYQNNLTKLQILIAQIMKTNKQSKTIVFAIKMFGYAYQIISSKNIKYPIYPMSISIPIDSRIKKIYLNFAPLINREGSHSKLGKGNKGDLGNKTTDTQIQNYFNDLSQKYNIPPLHIDSILWLNYWKQFVKK